MTQSTKTRFECTVAGAIAAGRRRLATIAFSLMFLMLILAVGCWLLGRWVPGSLALMLSFLVWTAWRMSGDPELLWMELDEDTLWLQMKGSRAAHPLADPTARRLSADEIHRIQGLATHAGIVTGSGGFDSHLLGEFALTATNFDNALLVDTGEARLIVTPDDPESFLTAIDSIGAAGLSSTTR